MIVEYNWSEETFMIDQALKEFNEQITNEKDSFFINNQMDTPERTLICLEHLPKIINLPGDLLELGVGGGTNLVQLALYLKTNNINKKVYGCDTFAGLPYIGQFDGDKIEKGKICYGIHHINKLIKILNLQDYIIPVIGLVEETLPELVKNNNFCFVFMDMDLYYPTYFAIKLLTPLLPTGSLLGFHDYNFHLTPGIKKAVNEVDKTIFKKIENKTGKDVLFFRKK